MGYKGPSSTVNAGNVGQVSVNVLGSKGSGIHQLSDIPLSPERRPPLDWQLWFGVLVFPTSFCQLSIDQTKSRRRRLRSPTVHSVGQGFAALSKERRRNGSPHARFDRRSSHYRPVILRDTHAYRIQACALSNVGVQIRFKLRIRALRAGSALLSRRTPDSPIMEGSH